MAIMFGCPDCGKTLRVGDNLGGKRCKCPGCGIILAIPAAEGVTAPPAEDLPRARSAPRSERSSRFDDADDDRSRRRRPARDDREPEPRDDGDDQDFLSKSKKKKRKSGGGSGMVLWLSIGGGGLVLLLLLGFGLMWMLGVFGGGIGSEAKYFPDDYDSIVCVDVESLRSSLSKTDMEKEFGNAGKDEMWGGLKTDDVRRLISAGKKNDRVEILHLKKKANAEDIAKSKDFKDRKYKSSKVGNGDLYESEVVPSEAFFVDGDYVVRGNPKVLKSVLERKGTAKTSDKMNSAMKHLSFKGGYSAVGLVSKEDGGALPGFESIAMEVNYSRNEANIKMVFIFRDSKDASDAYKKIKDEEKMFGKNDFRKKGSITHSGNTIVASGSATHEEANGAKFIMAFVGGR